MSRFFLAERSSITQEEKADFLICFCGLMGGGAISLLYLLFGQGQYVSLLPLTGHELVILLPGGAIGGALGIWVAILNEKAWHETKRV